MSELRLTEEFKPFPYSDVEAYARAHDDNLGTLFGLVRLDRLGSAELIISKEEALSRIDIMKTQMTGLYASLQRLSGEIDFLDKTDISAPKYRSYVFRGGERATPSEFAEMSRYIAERQAFWAQDHVLILGDIKNYMELEYLGLTPSPAQTTNGPSSECL